MITVVEYLVIAAVIGAVVFGLAMLVFGRGEQMAPLSARTSPSELPAGEVRGDHVREVRFGLALRGYRMSDVDWTLERLADELDVLRGRLAAVSVEAFDPRDPTANRRDPAGEAPAHEDYVGEAPAHEDPVGEAPAHEDPAGEAPASGAPGSDATANGDGPGPGSRRPQW